MALRRRSTDRERRHGPGAAAGLVLLAVLAAGCSILTLSGVEVRREGTLVTMTVSGHADPQTTAWLCPSDPGPGETWGAGGATRLTAFACINLGTSDPAPAGWSATFDVLQLPLDRLLRFAPGATYRLLLVAGDGGFVSTYSADLLPLSLAP